MNKKDFANWLDGDIKAWKSNNAQHIAKLFTEDAYYSMAGLASATSQATGASSTK